MIIDYINTHLAEFWITLGFLLIALEMLLFGLSTIALLFAGLGALLTGLIMLIGVLPESWVVGVASCGIGTGIISVLLWRPLRSLQQGRAPKSGQSSDLIGMEWALQQEISSLQSGEHRYSGIKWKVELDADSTDKVLAAGTRVAVVSVDAGIFRVQRCD